MQETLEYIKQAFELKSQQCYKQAIEMLYKALELENDNSEILFQLGELYFLLRNFPRATHYLEKVLQKNKNHIEALKIMQKIYIFSDEKELAYKTAEKIFNLQQTTENLIELIKSAAKTNDFKKIETIENSELTNDRVLFEIAKAYYDNGEFSIAKSELEKALNKNPENNDALVLLGKIYFDESDFEKSKQIFNSFSKTTENPEVLNYLGLFALEDLKFIDAIKYFSKASNLNKKNHRYLYNLGNAYFYNGWIKEAAQSYVQAICMSPDNLGYRYSLAYLYFEQKNYEKAQKEVDYILEHDAEYGLAHVLNALLKLEYKDFLGAQRELETNLKNGNNDNFTLISLATVYRELSMFEKAEKTIKKVIERNSDSLNYQCQLAEIYIAEKKYDDALNLVEKVLVQNENYITAYTTGAKAAFAKNDLTSTKDYAQKAISLDMNYSGGYFYLAMVRFAEKDYDEAIECMKRAIMFDVNNAEYYAKMSDIYKAKEDFKTALDYIKEAESISENTEYKLKYKELAALNRKIK